MKSIQTYIEEGMYNGYEIKFYNSVINKFNIDIDKVRTYISKVSDISFKHENKTLILCFDDSLSKDWNKYLDKINEIFSILKDKGIPSEALLRFAESGDHEEIYQEVEKVCNECMSMATPLNTTSMGNPCGPGDICLGGDSSFMTQQTGSGDILPKKKKRKIKSLKDKIRDKIKSHIKEKDINGEF